MGIRAIAQRFIVLNSLYRLSACVSGRHVPADGDRGHHQGAAPLLQPGRARGGETTYILLWHNIHPTTMLYIHECTSDPQTGEVGAFVRTLAFPRSTSCQVVILTHPAYYTYGFNESKLCVGVAGADGGGGPQVLEPHRDGGRSGHLPVRRAAGGRPLHLPLRRRLPP